MMAEALDFYDKIVCNTVAKTFELAAKQMPCYETSFCTAWLNSNICQDLSQREETIMCQSSMYFLNSLKKEISIPIHPEHKMDQEAMYWIGYTLTYWIYAKKIKGTEIASRYDLAEILSQYDILHTMSVRAAIKTIEETYSKGRVLLDNVLHKDK